VGELIKSLVEDIIMPALFQPVMRAANIEKIADLSYNGIFYGKFISTVIDFIVVAAVVYFVINNFQKRFNKAEDQVAKK
jgi:large conductance mechanosensitive channel